MDCYVFIDTADDQTLSASGEVYYNFVSTHYKYVVIIGVGLAVGLSVLGVCILTSVILILIFLWQGKYSRSIVAHDWV